MRGKTRWVVMKPLGFCFFKIKKKKLSSFLKDSLLDKELIIGRFFSLNALYMLPCFLVSKVSAEISALWQKLPYM